MFGIWYEDVLWCFGVVFCGFVVDCGELWIFWSGLGCFNVPSNGFYRTRFYPTFFFLCVDFLPLSTRKWDKFDKFGKKTTQSSVDGSLIKSTLDNPKNRTCFAIVCSFNSMFKPKTRSFFVTFVFSSPLKNVTS